MAIPALNEAWRTDPDDRELVRSYTGLPVAEDVLRNLTVAMNSVADLSPSAVAKIQGWIDEIEELEEAYAGEVADGTAHLGAVKSYEGLKPGANPTRDELLKAMGPLQWDTESLLRVRYEAGDGAGGTAVGQVAGRTDDLKARVLSALGLETFAPAEGTFALERS